MIVFRICKFSLPASRSNLPGLSFPISLQCWGKLCAASWAPSQAALASLLPTGPGAGELLSCLGVAAWSLAVGKLPLLGLW